MDSKVSSAENSLFLYAYILAVIIALQFFGNPVLPYINFTFQSSEFGNNTIQRNIPKIM